MDIKDLAETIVDDTDNYYKRIEEEKEMAYLNSLKSYKVRKCNNKKRHKRKKASNYIKH